MTKAGTKGRCACAAVPRWSSHPPEAHGSSQSTRTVLGVGQEDALEGHSAVRQGLLSSDDRILVAGLSQKLFTSFLRAKDEYNLLWHSRRGPKEL